MGKKLDLTGGVFGMLTVLQDSLERDKCKAVKWLCRCLCGNDVVVRSFNLKSGHTTSCGCYQKQTVGERFRTHGLSGQPLYRVWDTMIQRCVNQESASYQNYGGRGIKVCDRWLESFANFLEDVVHSYEEGLQLDRADNNGNYDLSNIRWVTSQQNNMNRNSFKESSSKYKGVCWNKARGKWLAQITKDYRNKYLGSFVLEEDAALAYNEAAKELFGEYANLNKIETN